MHNLNILIYQLQYQLTLIKGALEKNLLLLFKTILHQVPVYVEIKDGDTLIRVHKEFKSVHHVTITAESGT